MTAAGLVKQKIPEASLTASLSMFPLAPYLMATGKTRSAVRPACASAQICRELLVEVCWRLTEQSMRIGPDGRLFHLACIRFVPEGRLFFADARHVVEIVGGKRPLQKPSILEVSDVGKDAARLAETGPDMATARRRTGLALPGERRGLGAALRAFGADAPLSSTSPFAFLRPRQRP